MPVHEMAKLDPAAWDRIRAGLLPAYVDVPAFTARVVGAFDEVVAAHEGRATAVVVAHAGVINTWLAHLLGIARPLVFPLDYAGVTRVLAGRDGRRSVRTVNEIAHVADLLGTGSGREQRPDRAVGRSRPLLSTHGRLLSSQGRLPGKSGGVRATTRRRVRTPRPPAPSQTDTSKAPLRQVEQTR